MNWAENEMADCEELDYEEDDVSLKKSPVITSEKEEDIEEGEILDSDHKERQKLKCAFFQSGKCIAGDKCRFLHVKDKGFYKMLDSPPTVLPIIPVLPAFQNIYPIVPSFGECEMASTAWDQTLREAKNRIKEWDTKVNRARDPVVITIESDDEQLPAKSTEKPRCYKSPEPNMPHNSAFSGRSPERKSVEKKNEWCREVRWNDPWRRSPVSRVKSSASHSKSRRKKSSSSDSRQHSRSPLRRRRSHLSIFERSCHDEIVKNRHKPIIRRSSSSSSTEASLHRSRKKSLTKQENTKQEKKNFLSVRDELHKDPKALLEPVKKKLPPFSFAFDLLNKTKSKISPPFKNKPSKSPEPVKNKSPSFSPKADHQSNDAQWWTPKKIRLQTPVQSCSDMSISPLTDSSLSDLFDPDKNDRPWRPWQTSRSFAYTARKKHQAEIYGPAVPQDCKFLNSLRVESKIDEKDTAVNPPAEKYKATSPGAATKNKAVSLSKPKQVKKRNIDSLEGDLMKFQRQYRFETSKNLAQPSAIMGEKNKTDGIIHNQKSTETKKNFLSKELSRKEILLKQLKAIDAAIERKKKAYETQK